MKIGDLVDTIESTKGLFGPSKDELQEQQQEAERKNKTMFMVLGGGLILVLIMMFKK